MKPCRTYAGQFRRFRAWRVRQGQSSRRSDFGDCFAYAVAVVREESLLFKGEDFALTDVKQA